MIDEAKLGRWNKLVESLALDKSEEMRLRKELFGEAFPDPTEGSKDNKLDLANGWILQGNYKLSRTLDVAVVSTLAKGDNTGPLVDSLVEYKPRLLLPAWKKLSAGDLKLVAEMVVVKPGSPELKIVLPKKAVV